MLKSFGQQRATLRPGRAMAFFDDEDDDDVEDSGFLTDDGSSVDSPDAVERRNNTLMLAQFLATTGPEQFTKPTKKQSQQIRRASRLLNRLRKRPTMPLLRTQAVEDDALVFEEPPRTPTSQITTLTTTSANHTISSAMPNKRATHIPLPVYRPVLGQQPSSNSVPQLRDSGVYSDTSDKDTAPPPMPKPTMAGTMTNTSAPPTPTTTPILIHPHDMHAAVPPQSPTPSLPGRPTLSGQRHPRRPTPLPPAIASAAIAAACRSPSASTPTSSRAMSTCSNLSDRSVLRSVPAAALKRRSVRLRHVQVQTPTTSDAPRELDALLEDRARRACPHCRQCVSRVSPRSDRQRRLSSPPALASGPKMQNEAHTLLAMIEQLKQQLAEEQHSRRKLELAMSRQEETAKRLDLVAHEKNRWKGDCLWLDGRIASLPE